MITGLPQGSSLTAISESRWNGQWVTIPREALLAEGGAAFQLVRPARWLALERYLPWWLRPVFGSADKIPDGEYFLVLWERAGGGYGVTLPLVDGGARGVLWREGGEWAVRVPENDPLAESAALLFVATGDDPIDLVEWAVGKIAERLGTFQLREQKKVPQWADYLGWCTWDAFYLEVTPEQVLEGLASFKRGGL